MLGPVKKRPLGDDMDIEKVIACPRMNMETPAPAPAYKRTKVAPSVVESRKSLRPESPFLSISSPNEEILDNIVSFVPIQKRRKTVHLLQQHQQQKEQEQRLLQEQQQFGNMFACSAPQTTPSFVQEKSATKEPIKEKLFSLEDLKEILHNALSAQETRLREEYDRVLIERLQEQFASFSKFNEDCIYRQMHSSESSYIS